MLTGIVFQNSDRISWECSSKVHLREKNLKILSWERLKSWQQLLLPDTSGLQDPRMLGSKCLADRDQVRSSQRFGSAYRTCWVFSFPIAISTGRMFRSAIESGLEQPRLQSERVSDSNMNLINNLSFPQMYLLRTPPYNVADDGVILTTWLLCPRPSWTCHNRIWRPAERFASFHSLLVSLHLPPEVSPFHSVRCSVQTIKFSKLKLE